MTHKPTNAELTSIYAHRHVRGKMSDEELWWVITRDLRDIIHGLKKTNRKLVQEAASNTDEVMQLQEKIRSEREGYQRRLDTQEDLIVRLQAEVRRSQALKDDREEEWRVAMQKAWEWHQTSNDGWSSRVDALEKQLRDKRNEYETVLGEKSRLLEEVAKLTESKKEEAVQDNINITALIFNNKSGDGKHYSDQSISGSGKFIYMGQTKGKDDPKIVPFQTMYLERGKNNQPYVYRGLITGKEQICENAGKGATYELELDTSYVYNGIKSGQALPLVEGVKRGRGSYCIKQSCLLRLGLSPVGSLSCGILTVKK